MSLLMKCAKLSRISALCLTLAVSLLITNSPVYAVGSCNKAALEQGGCLNDTTPTPSTPTAASCASQDKVLQMGACVSCPANTKPSSDGTCPTSCPQDDCSDPCALPPILACDKTQYTCNTKTHTCEQTAAPGETGDGQTVKAIPASQENKTPKVCPASQNGKVEVKAFTCEGYPAINPNVAGNSNIGSTDGINTDCGTNKSDFITEYGLGYQSYEFATRYMWFRWGINMGPKAVSGPIPKSAQQPMETDAKTPTKSLEGLGSLAAASSDLCGLSPDGLKGATAFKPGDKDPVPGDLVVLTAGHIGVIIGTKLATSGKNNGKVASVIWANQNISTPDVADNTGAYSTVSPTDSTICMYIHANANKSDNTNSCSASSNATGGKGNGNGNGNSGGGTTESISGTFTGSVTATLPLVPNAANALELGKITDGVIKDGKVDSSTGDITGTLSGTITGTATSTAGALNGSLTAPFTATLTNGAIDPKSFTIPTGTSSFTATGSIQGTSVKFGSVLDGKMTDSTHFTAGLNGIVDESGKVASGTHVTGSINGTINAGKTSSTAQKFNIIMKFIGNTIPGVMTGTWDSSGQFNGTFTGTGKAGGGNFTLTVKGGTVNEGVLSGSMEDSAGGIPGVISGNLDSGSDSSTKVNSNNFKVHFENGDEDGTLTGQAQ